MEDILSVPQTDTEYELVEITPTDIRVRKKYLTSLDRRRHARELGKLEEEEN